MPCAIWPWTPSLVSLSYCVRQSASLQQRRDALIRTPGLTVLIRHSLGSPNPNYLATDKYRNPAVGQHLLRLAAKQHAGDPTPAVGRHEDEVAFALFRDPHDCVGRKIVGDVN